MSETEEARIERRVEAIRGLYSSDHDELMLATIRGDIAIADEEQAALRAEVERLTRECLDREATETDARERLRQAEERLAAVEAYADSLVASKRKGGWIVALDLRVITSGSKVVIGGPR